MMIELLQKAFHEMEKLPAETQQAYAEWLLAELADEERWDIKLQATLPQLKKLGEKALADFEAGNVEELDPDNL